MVIGTIASQNPILLSCRVTIAFELSHADATSLTDIRSEASPLLRATVALHSDFNLDIGVYSLMNSVCTVHARHDLRLEVLRNRFFMTWYQGQLPARREGMKFPRLWVNGLGAVVDVVPAEALFDPNIDGYDLAIQLANANRRSRLVVGMDENPSFPGEKSYATKQPPLSRKRLLSFFVAGNSPSSQILSLIELDHFTVTSDKLSDHLKGNRTGSFLEAQTSSRQQEVNWVIKASLSQVFEAMRRYIV
ncbi:hypothetical protein EK21DRAFT_94288 [Setomelanomma holmii]|uniref:Uncharacterized protein n=1 Tax=Setomelanomma holmii TaxID=210430 RepID=A0A9P4GWW2_9PLEO|nr:hypothetical protein EK21DRAFT_94288 [Setomelanomma holmii]